MTCGILISFSVPSVVLAPDCRDLYFGLIIHSIAADNALYDRPTNFLYPKSPVSIILLTATPFAPNSQKYLENIWEEKISVGT
jgi:hypothetical protein